MDVEVRFLAARLREICRVAGRRGRTGGSYEVTLRAEGTGRLL